MRSRPFAQVDVFSTEPFGGNPVAVVLDGEGLSEAEMQRFATWTNLSETTFVLAPTGTADYRVRIFTGSRELPFAGHPTLGTCHAWAGAVTPERVVQECAAGLIEIRRTEHGFAFAAPPLIRSGAVEPSLLAAVLEDLGVEDDVVLDAAWPECVARGVAAGDRPVDRAVRGAPGHCAWAHRPRAHQRGRRRHLGRGRDDHVDRRHHHALVS